LIRAVLKSRGLGISPSYYEHGPWLLSQENRRKIKTKEIPSCWIPHLLVVFMQQLEILVTALIDHLRHITLTSQYPKVAMAIPPLYDHYHHLQHT